jgi:hypothetical protein
VANTLNTPAAEAGATKSLPGLTPPSGNKDPRRRFGDVAVELGFVDRELVEQVMAKEREAHVPMGALLIESGLIDSDQLARILAERNSLAHVDLNDFEVDQGAANLIDAAGSAPVPRSPDRLPEGRLSARRHRRSGERPWGG